MKYHVVHAQKENEGFNLELVESTSTSAHPMSRHNFDHAPSTIFFATKIGVWPPGSNPIQLPFFLSRKYYGELRVSISDWWLVGCTEVLVRPSILLSFYPTAPEPSEIDLPDQSTSEIQSRSTPGLRRSVSAQIYTSLSMMAVQYTDKVDNIQFLVHEEV